MKKYDSMEAMRKALEQHKLCWQCEYCGKIYPSYQKLASTAMETPFVKDLQIAFSALQMSAKYGKSIHESWIPFLRRMEKEIIPCPDFWYKLYCLLRTGLPW